jgi:hypothetical protein
VIVALEKGGLFVFFKKYDEQDVLPRSQLVALSGVCVCGHYAVAVTANCKGGG